MSSISKFQRLQLLGVFTLCVAVPQLCFSQEEPVVSLPIEVPQQLAGLSAKDFAALVEKTRQSVVLVDFGGRDGKTLGLGSGFVVGDGLIATNKHVIGEARPISVKFNDGQRFDVLEVHATDKTQDLAIIRIDAKDLTPLKIGDQELLRGQPVFALGNPQGLEQSVVTGVVSGFRDEDDGMSLIQLAIPIEQGNSGGPLLDMQGNVHGLLTLKSQVTENLGYAVKASALRPLLKTPNPIPMSRWLTIGTLNQRLWTPSNDVSWKQRAGRIHVEGTGSGFGGRSLCFSKTEVPKRPYELAVDVRIQEDDGAAGLIFAADGGDLHYGFYPSSGALRLSRFDGPTVYSWNVLKNVKSKHYKPGEWNRLKVRLEEKRILCYCNDELIIESTGNKFQSGAVGLAKFRHTTADFKRFAVGTELPSDRPDDESLAMIRKASRTLPSDSPVSASIVKKWKESTTATLSGLEAEAQILEQRAERLRQLAREVHEHQVREELATLLSPPDSKQVNLLRAALLLAKLDNAEIDVSVYEDIVQQMTDEFDAATPQKETREQRFDRFHNYIFEDQGYHGSRTNYYHASNSYLNEVIDDREGLPITLSVLYIELARRVGFAAEGVGLPGHFVARLKLDEKTSELVDVFDGGTKLSKPAARKLVRDYRALPWDDAYLETQPAPAILVRMLRNLIGVANAKNDLEAALRYVKTVLVIEPDSPEDRLYKAVLCYHTERIEEGLIEVKWILDQQPEGIAIGRVKQLQNALLEAKE